MLRKARACHAGSWLGDTVIFVQCVKTEGALFGPENIKVFEMAGLDAEAAWVFVCGSKLWVTLVRNDDTAVDVERPQCARTITREE
jgi:hypothetical protein